MLIPFLYANSPTRAARSVPTCYVVKLLQECHQMLSGARWHCEGAQRGVKRPGYANHPYTRWLASSSWAYCWLFSFARSLGLREYPRRFRDKRVNAPPAYWTRIARECALPASIPARTARSTALCPLPSAAAVIYPHNTRDHALRAIEFRAYMAMHKNRVSWRFLYETRFTPRPHWMPPRTPEQEAIVRAWQRKLE